MSFYKISLQQQSNSVKFDALTIPAIDNYSNYCIVAFHGDFFIIQASFSDNKVTLHKIHKNGIIEKLSEDFTKISLGFVRNSKICSRGLYQNKEERIIARLMRVWVFATAWV